MSKLEFPGKIGQVSGFDSENDAAVMLVLETLLAGYARVAICPTPVSDQSQSLNIVLRPTDMGTFGRHFFLLPKYATKQIQFTHTIFRIGYKDELKTETDSKKRTVIRSQLTKQPLYKADSSTAINSRNATIPSLFPLSFEKEELYYIDVKEDWVCSNPEKRKDYFCYLIKSSHKSEDGSNQVQISFLSFFRREMELTSHQQAIVTYLRHLLADNFSLQDFTQRMFDPVKPGIVEGKKLFKVKSIQPLPTLPNTLDKNELQSDLVKSVVFIGENGYILSPRAHPYAGLLLAYINCIASSLRFSSGSSEQISSIASTRDQPDSELVLGVQGAELLWITKFYVPHTKRHLITIALRDSNIARLVFGSNSDWERRNHSASEMISTPGFGCLDNLVCRKAVSGLSDSTWIYFLNTATKNADINEMLGRTSDEIDNLLFADATFYRSFIGRSASYADAVEHWLRQQRLPDKTPAYDNATIDGIRLQIKQVYREAFSSYIQNVIGSILQTENTSNSHSKTTYIQTLQNGYEFRGYSSRSTEDRTDTTKLVYHIDSSKFLAINTQNNEKSCKRIDGGLYLYASKRDVKPQSSTDVLARDSDPMITIEKITAAYQGISYSSFCPYGYIAGSLHKLLDFSGNHLDFFPTSRIQGIIGGEISLFKPTNHTTARVSIVSGIGMDDHLEATAIQFFANQEYNVENPSEIKKTKEANKRHLEMLKDLKRIWYNYIFTRGYIRSLLPLKPITGTSGNRNRELNNERMMGLELARKLRLIKAISTIASRFGVEKFSEEYIRSNPLPSLITEISSLTAQSVDKVAVNIYDLLPYYKSRSLSYKSTSKPVSNKEKLEQLKQHFPNLTRNFYSNCDVIYGQDRLNLLFEAYEEFCTMPNSLTRFTNMDYVNGFLLTENFILHREGRDSNYPAYLNRDQYLAMSASVLYAKQSINEVIDFYNQTDSDSDSDSDESSDASDDASSDDENESIFKKSRLVNQMDVVKLFADGQVSKTVFANLANVPVYNVDADRNCDGDVFCSTLNEALSVNNSFLALLARSLHVKNSGDTIKFDFIGGREVKRQQGINITDTRRKDRNKPIEEKAPAQPVPQPVMRSSSVEGNRLNLGVAQPAMSSSSMWNNRLQATGQSHLLTIATPVQAQAEHEGQDVIIRSSYALSDVNLVTRVRAQLTKSAYIPKHERARVLIEEASRNRSSLRLLQPVSRKNANEKTFQETFIACENQVPRVIHMDRMYSSNILVAQYSELDIQDYFGN